MNHTRFEKNGAAVLLHTYCSICSSLTADTQRVASAELSIQLTFVHIQGQIADCNADHALWMIEELYGLSVEGEIPQVLHSGEIQSQRESFSWNKPRYRRSGLCECSV